MFYVGYGQDIEQISQNATSDQCLPNFVLEAMALMRLPARLGIYWSFTAYAISIMVEPADRFELLA